MFINPLTAAQGAIELLSDLTASNKKEDKEDTTSLNSLNYNINDMSMRDLRSLVLNLTEKGTLSEQDSTTLLSQIDSVTKTEALPTNTKLDWITIFQQQVYALNPKANSKEMASLNHSLELLHGLKARAGTKIPEYV